MAVPAIKPVLRALFVPHVAVQRRTTEALPGERDRLPPFGQIPCPS